jgi:hypothetical protein
VRNIFRRTGPSSVHPKNDSGTGDWNQYAFDLLPTNRNVTMQLAESSDHQDELAALVDTEELQAFVPTRTQDEERTDAPVAVRFFVESRMTGVVGLVPRGLEPIVFEAVARLESAGRSTRIPAKIVKTRHGLRVALLMGQTR